MQTDRQTEGRACMLSTSLITETIDSIIIVMIPPVVMSTVDSYGVREETIREYTTLMDSYCQ